MTERGALDLANATLSRRVKLLREGLDAAIRAADLALFVIRKQGVMPNDSWQAGFERDMATAKAAKEKTAPGAL